MTRATAIGVLLVLGSLTVYGLATPVPLVNRTTNSHVTDAALFQVVAERIGRGESYYPAMKRELDGRGYASASVFNWRPPALIVVAGKTPQLARGVLVALGIAVLILTFSYLRDVPLVLMALGVVVQLGALVPAFVVQGLYLPESWAGIFLALSLIAYSRSQPIAGACCAALAACARDLALPYLFVCLVLSTRADRRWLIACALAVCGYYGWHAWQVRQFVTPDAASNPSWIAFGGWPFLISTVQASGWFLIAPRALAVLGAVLVAGSALRSPRHLRWTVVAYFGVFAFVGLPMNAYWGLLLAPAWALAIPYGCLQVAEAWRTARAQSPALLHGSKPA